MKMTQQEICKHIERINYEMGCIKTDTKWIKYLITLNTGMLFGMLIKVIINLL